MEARDSTVTIPPTLQQMKRSAGRLSGWWPGTIRSRKL